MVTPEKIKKGLECCTPVWAGNHWKTCNSNCPYIGLADSCRGQLVYDALAYIQQLEAKVPKWIGVKERLPETEGKYIVCTAKGSVYCTRFKAYGKSGAFQTDMNTHVTHWMPLPEPPKEEV